MDTTQHDFESELARTSLPYPEEAYDFVREGLGYTVNVPLALEVLRRYGAPPRLLSLLASPIRERAEQFALHQFLGPDAGEQRFE